MRRRPSSLWPSGSGCPRTPLKTIGLRFPTRRGGRVASNEASLNEWSPPAWPRRAAAGLVPFGARAVGAGEAPSAPHRHQRGPALASGGPAKPRGEEAPRVPICRRWAVRSVASTTWELLAGQRALQGAGGRVAEKWPHRTGPRGARSTPRRQRPGPHPAAGAHSGW